MFKLDHVIMAVQDLAQAVEDYRSLGFTVIPAEVQLHQIFRLDGFTLVLRPRTHLAHLPAALGYVPEEITLSVADSAQAQPVLNLSKTHQVHFSLSNR